MIPVLTKEQAYKLDEDTITSGHLTKQDLMDKAGKIVAEFFCENVKNPFNQKVVIVCGKGNNGGDGVIVHSYLKKFNVSSKIILTELNHGHSILFKKYKISKSDYLIYNNKIKFDEYDWIIDAIFGIGLSRDLNKKYIKLIEKLNLNENILSVDIPSGMYVDTSKSKNFVNSRHTVTFSYPKLGHYLLPINSLFFKDIGFKQIDTQIHKIESLDILKILKPFKKKSKIHKNTKGRVYIHGGSLKYPGAAILASSASLKAGSGYVNLDITFKSNDKQRKFLISSIKSLYPDIIINSGSLFNYNFDSNNKTIGDYNNVLFGPGIDHKENADFLSSLDNVENFVIDAGGFLSFSDISQYNHKKAILTPHLGELKKIFKLKNDVIIDASLLNFIQNKIDNKIIILKLFNTFIITKDIIYIMDTGPSILATAGTGDVLSGILISLLSQGYSRIEASILGTYLHAEAANYYLENISKEGLTASDLIKCIPYAFNKLRKQHGN